MKIANPQAGQKFDVVYKDHMGNPTYGVRNPNTADEEIVHIPSNKSNQNYYIPDVVLDPTGCEHDFIVTDVNKREIECNKCQYESSFVLGVNAEERDNKLQVILNKKTYSISL